MYEKETLNVIGRSAYYFSGVIVNRPLANYTAGRIFLVVVQMRKCAMTKRRFPLPRHLNPLVSEECACGDMADRYRNDEDRAMAALVADFFRLLPGGNLMVISLHHLQLYFFVTRISKGMAL